MGTWGTGLYDNDAAADLRGTFADLVRIPGSDDELLARIRAETPALDDADDEDHAATWLALADLFHRYGIAHAGVSARAAAIVRSGQDLDVSRALGMEAADVRRRERTIAKAAERWRSPHPKPRRRRLLTGPEPLLLTPGEALAYPTMGGNAIEAAVPPRYRTESFAPDGYGAFVVLHAGRRYGYYATYLVARLHLRTVALPSPTDIEGAAISGLDQRLPLIPVDPTVKVVTTTKRELKTLDVSVIGRWSVDLDTLARALPDHVADLDDPSWSLTGLLRPHSTERTFHFDRPVAVKDLRIGRFLAPAVAA